ncbi:MAG: ABC transporter permease [Candidatus Eiseniibacteriota bacterium]
MTLSPNRAFTIARREYLTTIRRKAFLFTLILTPLYFGGVMTFSMKSQVEEQLRAIKNFGTLGVVDSSGQFAASSNEIRTVTTAEDNPFEDATHSEHASADAAAGAHVYHADVRQFAGQAQGEQALRNGEVQQLLVIPVDYLVSGKLRRYTVRSSMFSSADDRPVASWLVSSLLTHRVDSTRIERVSSPTRSMSLYTIGKTGHFELKDGRREILEFLLPFMLGMLLSMCIVTGGQYLLQGVAEEKESRILESLLCTVTPEELMVGKLIGLGGAALTLVGAWVLMGLSISAPAAVMARAQMTPSILLAGLVYLLLGFLFYASLMTGIGAITNNMREAQQFAFMFTFANFIPFILIAKILAHPDGALAVGLSMFPPTAATSMMLRMSASSSLVPPWQIALSLAILAAAAAGALLAAARVFRIGLLMYGKTPSLPEILRWVRQG